jgi:hypothetical protein
MYTLRLTLHCQYLFDLQQACQEAEKSQIVTNLRFPARAELLQFPLEWTDEIQQLFAKVLRRFATSPDNLTFSQTSEKISLKFKWNEFLFHLKPLAEKYHLSLPEEFEFVFATGVNLDKVNLFAPELAELSFRLTVVTPSDVKEFRLREL